MNNSNTKKAIKGMSSQTLVTFSLGFVEIIAFSILSRLLSQEDFGYYAAITAITMIFDSLSDMGIGSSVIQRKNIDSRYINNAFTLSFISGLLLTVALLVLAYPLAIGVADKSLTLPLMIMSVTLFTHSVNSVTTAIMKRRLEFLKIGVYNLMSLIIATIIAVLFAILGFGVYSILAKVVLNTLVFFVLSFYGAKTSFHFCIDKTNTKTIFRFSGWLTASAMFRNLAHQIDKLMLGRFLSITALGEYNRPKEFILQITSKLGGIFDSVLFPVLSSIQDETERIRNSYLKSLYLLNLSSIIIALVFIFNGELIVRIFFGEKWLNILPVFRILSLTIIFYFDARLADCYLRSLGLTKQQFLFRIVEFFLKIIGILIGYHWGVIGVALSVVITDIISVFIKHLYIANKLNISLSQSISILLYSWKICLWMIPIMLLLFVLIPDSFCGCIIKALLFSLFLVILLLFIPSAIGFEYRKKYHSLIITFLKNKIKK